MPVPLAAGARTLDVGLAAATVTCLTTVLVAVMSVLNAATTADLPRRSASNSSPVGATRSQWLVAGELALSVTLLAGAVLLIVHFVGLLRTDLGFDPDRVLTARVRWPILKAGETVRHYPTERFVSSFRTVTHALAAQPGIESVSAVTFAPFAGQGMRARYVEAGAPILGSPEVGSVAPRGVDAPDWRSDSAFEIVGPGYFRTMRIPVLQGREFTEEDALSSAQLDTSDMTRLPGAVIVSESLARALWPGDSAIGGYLILRGDEYNSRQVVGVVGDVMTSKVGEQPRGTIYVPYLQDPMDGTTFVVRTRGAPSAFSAAVRRVVQRLGEDAALGEIRPLDALVADSLARPRFASRMAGLFALAGFLLTIVGVYAVLSFVVAQRTKEFGVRLAVGADWADIRRLVLGEAARVMSAGVVLGSAAAIVAARLLDAVLSTGQSSLGLIVTGAAASLFASGLAAAYVPARRASRVDPVVTLRSE
jgi:predicted permease